MPRIFAIFFVLILVLCGIAQKVFKVPLTKHYVNNMKVADNTGKFYPNPYYVKLREPKEEFEIDASIWNENDILYYGKLWFSYSDTVKYLEVIFDTGSSWLWTNVEGCKGCPSNEFLSK